MNDGETVFRGSKSAQIPAIREKASQPAALTINQGTKKHCISSILIVSYLAYDIRQQKMLASKKAISFW